MVEPPSTLAVPQLAPRRDAGDAAALGLVLLALVGVPWTLWAAGPAERVPFADVAAIPAACVACWPEPSHGFT